MPADTVDLIRVDDTDNKAIERGATFRATLIWKTGDTVASALPVDLTGYHARMMFKANSDRDSSQIIAISKANPGVVTTKKAHKLKTGQTVRLPLVGGMVELTARYTVTKLAETTFSIGVDTTAYTTYTSGGTVAFASITDVLSDDGQLILGTTGGDIQIYLTDATTNEMSGCGVHDLEAIAPNNDVVRVAQGDYEVDPNVTGV